ncbi:MAG: magnesium transporter CorA [Betaproteobacteria bacterium]|nr:magnesium transporter CorA [Betaproteobacteria bacterium]NBY72302.1 magnesium transporter CorA [Betaproteobacteria bacterium]
MSLEKLAVMLQKVDLVPQAATQPTNKSDLIASLLAKQQQAELTFFIERQSTPELGVYLDTLAELDAQKLWVRIPPARQNEVLWEVSEARRQAIAGDRQPHFSGSKINLYELVEGKVRQVHITDRKVLEGTKPVWVDLVNASPSERAFIGAHFGVELADPVEATELEVTARFYVEENDNIHLHSNFLHDKSQGSRSVPVAFILHGGVLFSLRNEELPVFRLQQRRTLTQPGYITDSIDLLLDLYGADVECSADSLENIYAKLGQVGHHVLSENISDQEAGEILADIAEEEDQNGHIRSNIMDTQRALNFLMRGRLLKPDQVTEANQILRNIESLNSHTAFLFDKINFLMDATIGFININQNKRINQLTVFSVVFMPINILAGMGGMSEFSMMTEGIPWPLSYTAFAIVSGLIGAGTYVLLKVLERKRLKRMKARAP